MQGINRTLLSWIKLWDETVFGYSSLPATSTVASLHGRKIDERTGVGIGSAKPVSDRGRRESSNRGRGGVGGGKKEWKEFRDPATFASEEVILVSLSKLYIQHLWCVYDMQYGSKTI